MGHGYREKVQVATKLPSWLVAAVSNARRANKEYEAIEQVNRITNNRQRVNCTSSKNKILQAHEGIPENFRLHPVR